MKSCRPGLVCAETWRFIICPLLYMIDSAGAVQDAAGQNKCYLCQQYNPAHRNVDSRFHSRFMALKVKLAMLSSVCGVETNRFG